MTKVPSSARDSIVKVLETLIGMASDGREPRFAELAQAAGLDPARDFVGASLCDLDFRDEDLQGFDFSHADLSGVDFRRANIAGVSFAGADLTGAIGLVGARFRDFVAAPEMIVVRAGSFLMGSSDDDKKGHDGERPQHAVMIKSPFVVGVAPVTRGEFAAFIGDTKYKMDSDSKRSWRKPGFAQTDDHPVVLVTWHDAHAYVAWLRQRSGGKDYRLLTEAEWEYCCRAGTVSTYSTGNAITPAQANFGEKGTTPVSRFPPNPWGLRDMHGNVWEWCEDSWHPNYEGAPEDGSIWPGGDAPFRVLRGGSWISDPQFHRSADRNRDLPDYRDYDVGFRVARTL
jgi:formylglycine-generating enzyme required for sulfatase activity